jgi:hypothetical protein
MLIALYATTLQDNGLTCTIQVVWDREADNYTVSNCSHDSEWCSHYGIFSELDRAFDCYVDNLEIIHSRN